MATAMIRSLSLCLFMLAAAQNARADDDQICFAGSAKNLEASIKACSAILGRPLLTPEWKLRALRARGHYHERNHRLDMALSDYNAAVATDPSDRGARIGRAEIFVSMGKFREAQRDIDALQKTFPNDPELLNNSCWIHAALWELDAALADCNRSLALAPREANTLDSLGFVHLRMRNYKQALADYNAALAIAPGHDTSLYVRGVIKRKLGDLAGGNADIKAAGKINPEVAESFAPYGLTQGN
jgi:tetratricopeptide (TPR) repeat protein